MKKILGLPYGPPACISQVEHPPTRFKAAPNPFPVKRDSGPPQQPVKKVQNYVSEQLTKAFTYLTRKDQKIDLGYGDYCISLFKRKKFQKQPQEIEPITVEVKQIIQPIQQPKRIKKTPDLEHFAEVQDQLQLLRRRRQLKQMQSVKVGQKWKNAQHVLKKESLIRSLTKAAKKSKAE